MTTELKRVLEMIEANAKQATARIGTPDETGYYSTAEIEFKRIANLAAEALQSA